METIITPLSDSKSITSARQCKSSIKKKNITPTRGAKAVIEMPLPTPLTAGYVIRGHTMGAIRDGWVVFIEQTEEPPSVDLVGQLVLAKLYDGRLMCRFLQKGRRSGRWDLLSVTGAPDLDAAIEWAAPVTWIKQHELTEEQRQAFFDVA